MIEYFSNFFLFRAGGPKTPFLAGGQGPNTIVGHQDKPKGRCHTKKYYREQVRYSHSEALRP